MKNQDIFELFQHLKTLFGGNAQKKSPDAPSTAGDKKSKTSTSISSEQERKLRDFHLRHDALSRKITAAQKEEPLSQGTVISLREKRGAPRESAPTKGDSTPLFPPSFP